MKSKNLITSFEECIEIAENTLSELKRYLKEQYPQLSDLIDEITDTALIEVSSSICSKTTGITRKKVKKDTVVNFCKYYVFNSVLNYVITNDVTRSYDIIPLISGFRDVLELNYLLLDVVFAYALVSPNEVEYAIKVVASKLKIPPEQVDYTINYAISESVDRKELSFFLCLIASVTYSLSDLPYDVIPNFTYYLLTLEYPLFSRLIQVMPPSLVLLTVPDAILILYQLVLYLYELTCVNDLITISYNFALPDQYTIYSINSMNAAGMIPDERLEDAISAYVHSINSIRQLKEPLIAETYVYSLAKYTTTMRYKHLSPLMNLERNDYRTRVILTYEACIDLTTKIIQLIDHLQFEIYYKIKVDKIIKEFVENFRNLAEIKTLEKIIEGLTEIPFDKIIELTKKSKFAYLNYTTILNQLYYKILELGNVIV